MHNKAKNNLLSAEALAQLYRGLDTQAQQSLSDYVRFLETTARANQPAPPSEPLAIPRPEKESVVGALKRLRQTYPMLDAGRTLLDQASSLMTQHLVHGRNAVDVIDELEGLFVEHFQRWDEIRRNEGLS
ncbi:MAG: hypothetical protein ACO376_02360 [Gammaproteobacteria bacterium]